MRFCFLKKLFLFNNRGGSTAARGGYEIMTAVFPLPCFACLVGWAAWVGGLRIIHTAFLRTDKITAWLRSACRVFKVRF